MSDGAGRRLAWAALGLSVIGMLTGIILVAALMRNDSSIAVAGSTLAVAALFQPLRRRVQASVGRRFNRARYNADHTETFLARLRDEVHLGSVRADQLGVVGETPQPASAGLWLRGAP